YSAALAAVPLLPRSFARPVAVAAHVYRGIHNGIRRRRYDNLRTRSYTSAVAKGYHATRALWELYTRRADHTITGSRVALVASGDDGPA
ncbi:MAG TPA: hypothetical protein VK966_06500, partial [Longimicrobiales bacterium]|nr:hypothetical protein [Longimicrobiales bacterium]